MTRKYKSLTGVGEWEAENWRDIPDYTLGPWWLGDFTESQLSTADYGDNSFHGRFHPAIPYVAMKKYTKRGEVVWDCFAGSGTTLDVGVELGRKVIATDIKPVRSDIVKADASIWHPAPDSVNLGIMHPPYMGIINYDCPMSRAGDVDEFVSEFEACFYNMDVSLRCGSVVVIVIGEIWKDKQLLPLEYNIHDVIHKIYHYRLLGRIVKDFGGHTKGGPVTNTKHKNLWKYRLIKYGYFRNGIDTILFYQKLG